MQQKLEQLKEKKEESLQEQAEKTVSKMGAFFKNAFQKIEDSFASPSDTKQLQKKQEESKAKPGPFALPPQQTDPKAPPQKIVSKDNIFQQPQKVAQQFTYAGASPIKRSKPDTTHIDTEVVEEIIFHHPHNMLSSPTKFFKSLLIHGAPADEESRMILETKP